MSAASDGIAMSALAFVIPGDITLRTGGYIYDRRVLALLGDCGVEAHHVALPGSFPSPTHADLEETARLLGALPPSMPLLIDGLAYGAFPETLAARIVQPIVALVHHPLFLETGLDAAQQTQLHALEKRALLFARAVITTSTTTATTVAQEFGYPAAHIHVAEPGTDPGQRARMKAPDESGTVRLLAVGSIVPRKAYGDLVAALDTLADLDWHLTIAGDGTRSPKTTEALLAQIAASRCAERITLAGALDDAALSGLYSASDAFVMSSLYEGYGMVLSEALAHGLPIVATRAGAAAETVPDSAALKVEPGAVAALAEALRRIVMDGELRCALAQHAWAAGQRLPRWIDTARRIAAVVNAVSKGRP